MNDKKECPHNKGTMLTKKKHDTSYLNYLPRVKLTSYVNCGLKTEIESVLYLTINFDISGA